MDLGEWDGKQHRRDHPASVEKMLEELVFLFLEALCHAPLCVFLSQLVEEKPLSFLRNFFFPMRIFLLTSLFSSLPKSQLQGNVMLVLCSLVVTASVTMIGLQISACYCHVTFFFIPILRDFKIFGLSDQIRSVAQLCPTLSDPMNHSTPGLPVHHQLPEFTETHVHRVSDAIQPPPFSSCPSSSPSPLAPNPSQHQSLFQ